MTAAGARPRVPAIRRPWPGLRTLPVALALLGVLTAILAGIEIALLFGGPPDPPWAAALFPIGAAIYAAAGIVAWGRRSANLMGAIMLAGAAVWIVAGLVNTPIDGLVAAGLIVTTLPLAVVVHLLLAFPSGRLRTPLALATVIAGYLVSLVLQIPRYVFDDGVLQIAHEPDLAQLGIWVQAAAGLVVMAVTAWILAGRLRHASPRDRWVLGPLNAYGILVVIIVPLTGNVEQLAPVSDVSWAVVQILLLAAVPIAFAVAVARGGFARTADVEQLAAWLGGESGHRPQLREAVAATLGDPSVELLFWVPDAGGYVDDAARPAALPAPGGARAGVEVTADGENVGAIVYDAGLIADPALVRHAGRVIALALERERLTAELRAGREHLRRSRTRLVTAADQERRRIARDLHDGLQTRMVLLAMTAQRAAADPHADPEVRAITDELRAGLQAAIDELRVFVHGVMPAALTQGGLAAAAEDLADRAPFPTALHVGPVPATLPPAVESTGWFVMSEAMSNAVKHSHAHAMRISMGADDGCLRIEIADDGVGGATIDGTGLRGLADRVEAQDGRLIVDSPPGGGTRIVAEVPCAS